MDAVIETRLSDHMKYVAKFTITSENVEELKSFCLLKRRIILVPKQSTLIWPEAYM
jgi:hypothetical protein